MASQECSIAREVLGVHHTCVGNSQQTPDSRYLVKLCDVPWSSLSSNSYCARLVKKCDSSADGFPQIMACDTGPTQQLRIPKMPNMLDLPDVLLTSSLVNTEGCQVRMAQCMQIPHLVELGINAVELLPVFEYDELEFQRIPNPRDHMVNIWGYSHINFFAPMSRYAADGAGPAAAAKEFKQMVQQFHKAGIEVILDVVYNHTAEGGSPCCVHSLSCCFKQHGTLIHRLMPDSSVVAPCYAPV